MNKFGYKISSILFFVLILLMFGCASRRYEKLALKNEQAGLYEDATELYIKSLKANINNIDSKIGAKKNGQITLDKKLSDFSKAYSNGQINNAVNLYQNAKTYYRRLHSDGILLDFPSYYEDQYNEVKQMDIEEKYKKGIKLLNEENFSECETFFKSILKLDPNYKDVKDLLITAHYEPLYRQGKNYFDNKFYRKSYFIFNDIINEINNYKQSIQLKQDALDAAIFPIWVKPFTFSSNAEFVSNLQISIINFLNNSQNPFIKIIDKTNSQDILNEQQLNLTNNVDKNSSAQAGKLLGSKAILTAKLVSIQIINGDLQCNKVKGYFKYRKDNLQGQTVDKYKKIHYNQYNQIHSAKCVFKFQLSSTETGAIQISDEFESIATDEIHFATYPDGDYKNVYPGYWKWELISSSEDVKNFNEMDNLQSLFEGNRNIKSIDILVKELINNVSEKVSQEIINYNPEN